MYRITPRAIGSANAKGPGQGGPDRGTSGSTRVRVVASHGQIAIRKLHLANPISESAGIADIC